LNKAHVQYLESQLIKRAATAKRMPLENGNTPTEPTLSEADRADMDVFLANILSILPILGVHAFEQSSKTNTASVGLLTCQGKGIKASGFDTPQGFVVQSGSFASKELVPSLKDHFPRVCVLHDELKGNGVLMPAGDQLKFMQDYTFNSPSLAAAIVLGRAANGRIEWKDNNGKTLKEFQEAQAAK